MEPRPDDDAEAPIDASREHFGLGGSMLHKKHTKPKGLRILSAEEARATVDADGSPIKSQLQVLVSAGNLDGVKKLIDESAASDRSALKSQAESLAGSGRYPSLVSALLIEKESLSVAMVSLLITELKVDPLICDSRGNNAVHWACRLGKSIELQALGLDSTTLATATKTQNKEGDTPLHVASRFGQIKCMLCLFEAVSGLGSLLEYVEVRNARAMTPYDVAADRWDPDTDPTLFKVSEPAANRADEDDAMTDVRIDITKERENIIESAAENMTESAEPDPLAGYERALSDRDVDEDARQRRRVSIHDLFCLQDAFYRTTILHHAECAEHGPLVPAAAMSDAGPNYYDRKDTSKIVTRTATKSLPMDEKTKSLKVVDEVLGTSMSRSNHSMPHETVPRTIQHNMIWEAPDRIDSILNALRKVAPHRLKISSDFPPASRVDIERAHSKKYVDFVYGLSDELNAPVKNGEIVRVFNNQRIVPFTPLVQRRMMGLEGSDVKEGDVCDTAFSEGSLKASLRAAGSVISGIDSVVSKTARNVFCAVRPPGHHAGVDGLLEEASSCGFCIFNNVAIGALYALDAYPGKIQKVAIVDFDVHHGNGTEEICRKFYEEKTRVAATARGENNPTPQILFFSTHLFDVRTSGVDKGYEFYPGSGERDDFYYNVVNVPFDPLWRRKGAGPPSRSSNRAATYTERAYNEKFGRRAFRKIVTSRLLPALRAYSPDLILFSAGFDAARLDVGNCRGHSLNGFDLMHEDFLWVTKHVGRIANMVCDGRMVSVLEGGYGRFADTTAGAHTHTLAGGGKPPSRVLERHTLARNVRAHVEGLKSTLFAEEGVGPWDDEDGEELEHGNPFFVPAGEDGEEQYGIKRTSGARRAAARRAAAASPVESESAEPYNRPAENQDLAWEPGMDEDDGRDASLATSRKKRKLKPTERLLNEDGSRKRLEYEDTTPKPFTMMSAAQASAAKRQRLEAERALSKEKDRLRESLDKLEEESNARKKDAVAYLSLVKQQTAGDPETYARFLRIMGRLKTGTVSVSACIEEVQELFAGSEDLIKGFSAFLPRGAS